jgi:CPA2 family monovalent cation:H+ antiporter-2
MAAPINLADYKDAMVVLATAGVLVPLVHRFRVSPVLGFLLAGAVLGPSGLGALAAAVPGLSWLSIANGKGVAEIAEFGVVFLLFLIGLELSLPRLLTMRRLVFGLGTLQVAVSAAAIGLGALMLGSTAPAALVIGSCLALSSTAIVIEILSRQRRLATATGRTSFAVLLLQDLAVVPILFLVGILGARKEGSLALDLVQALGQAAAAIALIVLLGRFFMRPLFRIVASTESTELFTAATLFVAVGTSLVTAAAGLSMALGGFVAGLLLAETEFRRAIEAAVEPFKGLLLGVFFFSAGMSLDLGRIVSSPLPLIACALGLIALKAALLAGLARSFRIGWPAALETGLLLGPGGEFAFVVLALAAANGAVPAQAASFALTVVALSMVAIPAAAVLGRAIARRLEPPHAVDPELLISPTGEEHARAIVVGHGRVGELVSDMLARHGVAWLATDRDPLVVARVRRDGRPVYYGDARNEAFLKRCGIAEAAAVIITIHTQSEIDEIVRGVRALRPDIVIVSRARDAVHASHLYELGVTDAVPETIEASLQLSEAALVGLGIAMGPVIASIHEKRDEVRRELQAAAGKAGRTSRAVRGSRRA